ncbi:sensor histidine kinase [Microbispora sp. NPDC049125]|uniref:sensor histidine kinase n=1 Tax=Microbispora sp. NPDC049125 TaxID=3154929 RepID=UPI00346536DC
MVRRTLTALGGGTALLGLALLGQIVGLITLAGVLLSFMLGLVFAFPPAVRLARATIGLHRSLVLRLTGTRIDVPYLPAPPPPVPLHDGWYRDGRKLYRTPLIPSFNQRLNWLFKDPATWRDLTFLLMNLWTTGLVVAAPVLLAVLGVVRLVSGDPLGVVWTALGAGVAPWYAPRAVRAYGRVAEAMLGPTRKARLAQQVDRLSAARTEVVDSQAAELRRIERDLHDGAQARLVAIGMTIGAAEELLETDPNAARALLGRARDASATALQELRRLVRGIHPPVLAERGLGDAVRAIALDTPLRTHVTVDLPGRPEAPIESAAYFAVSELLSNAVRHGGAGEVWIDISHQGPVLRVTTTDDGHGGADASRGTGLNGIERRIGAFDGILAVSSPPGGPTTAVIELPRAFAAPRRSPIADWRTIVIAMCWTLCWIPLFPQGLVTMGLKLAGVRVKSWFLAMHVAEPFQWPVIIGMILLGGAMLTTGVVLSARQREAEVGVCA